MTNRERLQSLSDYELAKHLIVHYCDSDDRMCYLMSDDTIFKFNNDNKDEMWKDALLHEIEWLEKESE